MISFIKTTWKIAALASMLCLSNVNMAQQHSEPFEHQKVSIDSKLLGEKREITVRLPKSYQSELDKHYPVIYRLDGAINLPLMNAVLDNLQEVNAAPEVIIVAIENTERLRDLFPSENKDPRGPLGLGGGGGVFLKFIESELIPHINQNYRAHDFKVIAGASAAGVFALYAMQSSTLFNAHIAYSPAVWWNDGAAVKRTAAFVDTWASANDDESRGYLFMSIGSEAEPMRAYYDEVQELLVSNVPQTIKLVTEAYENVPHDLVSSAGIFSAYHNLFLPLDMPLIEFTGAVDSISHYYQRVSHQRGGQVTPPEQSIRYMGYAFVDKGELQKANAIFKYNIENHPESAEAYNGAAFGFERAGNYEASLEHVEEAIALSAEGQDGYDVFLARRERLQAILAD